jgi:hypothetical protein
MSVNVIMHERIKEGGKQKNTCMNDAAIEKSALHCKQVGAPTVPSAVIRGSN